MTLRPWREIARPHRDVLEGTFKQSEFAADITQVATGTAPQEYQDAAQFFARTYLTEGMRLLLISVLQRLAGTGGDPVIQLQTAFGGGKTHSMLAAYHLASRKVPLNELEGIPTLLDQARIDNFPTARVAVLDGINLSVSQGKRHGKITANTLWGELAWQLMGTEGYELIAASDQNGTAPGKDLLKELFERSAPCVILIDELQKFFSDLKPGRPLNAGTYEANLKFIQALTEALKAVPNALLLASLPESDTEAGDTFGQKTLEALEKHFGRLESVWKPVATEEAFEIVRRRLFDFPGDPDQVEAVSRSFCDFYRQHSQHFPEETQTGEYFERICNSYPIHPEIFDRLYEDWSTLEKFQRTRGVLQYMAVIIHRLWEDNNQDALIMPGSIPLEDSIVRNKSIHYLPQGWEPVIEREVDGPRSEPQRIDRSEPRFGALQAARRTMRTIFLGSAPSAREQAIKGIQTERILLGATQPNHTVGVFQDVLKRLRDRLHYLYTDQDRFWLDTKPNLRREMESRKTNIDKLEVEEVLKKRIQNIFGKGAIFSGVHVFSRSQDIPDDYGSGPRLVVLEPRRNYSRTDASSATEAAEAILKQRGDQPRQKRNRLLFLAAETEASSRLIDTARTAMAWKEICDDIEDGKINLDIFQVKQAQKNAEGAEKNLKQVIRETYKWILCPAQLQPTQTEIEWETVSISTNSQNPTKEIETRLVEEEWVTTQWSPIHLKNILEQWYFKPEIKQALAQKVFQDTCHYLYLPRLINENVFKETVAQGVRSQDFFGYASGQEGEKILGLCYGDPGVSSAEITLDERSILIQAEAAQKYQEQLKQASTPPIAGAGDSRSTGNTEGLDTNEKPEQYIVTIRPNSGSNGGAAPVSTSPVIKGNSETPSPNRKQFYGTVQLNPIKAKLDFATVVDEVIQNFTLKPGVEITVTIDIQAHSEKGFDDKLQRAVKENCGVLKFKACDFE